MAERARPIRPLIAGVLLAGGCTTPAGDSPLRLAALVWIAPEHEYAALTRQPAMCAVAAPDPDQAEAGRALFNAPMLLGGQAARFGLSCASCHVNGRGNAHFFLSVNSSQPGTADVSASFFGPARSNAAFDPVPIPDLAVPGKVSRSRKGRQLEEFLRVLVVEEFAGREPGEQALDALAAYVRTIAPCPDRANVPQRLSGQLDLIRASVRGARWFAVRGDARSSALLVAGARRQLGLIDERLADRRLSRDLLTQSRRLQPIAQSAAPEPARLADWLARFEHELVPRLRQAERGSLYDPAIIVREFPAAE